MPDCHTFTLSWRKSSYSASGDCVEVAISGDSVWVRDSKRRESPTLEFPSSEWHAFLTGIRDGRFARTSLEAPRLSANDG
jgi:hypothetical protein